MGWEYEGMDKRIRLHRPDPEKSVWDKQTSPARRGYLPGPTVQSGLFSTAKAERNLVGYANGPNYSKRARRHDHWEPHRDPRPVGTRVRPSTTYLLSHTQDHITNEKSTTKGLSHALAQEAWTPWTSSNRTPGAAS